MAKGKTIFQSVETKDLTTLEKIITAAPEQMDRPNEREESPLLVAVKEEALEEAKFLIDHGANVNQQDAIKDSPYLFAAAQGKTEILAYMIHHAQPDQSIVNRFGGNALIPAAEKGHLENVRLLLEDGSVAIDHQNDYGYTALIEAVALRDGSPLYQEIIRELLQHGANTNLRDRYGKTALDYAKELGYVEIQELLNQKNS